MWWFGRWKVGVNIWLSRCLCWVRLRWSWFRTAHLVLWPGFVTKPAWTERAPVLQLLLISPSPFPGFLHLVGSHQEQGGWSGGGDTARTAHPKWLKRFQTYHIMLSHKGRAQGGDEGFFPNYQVLRSWVGIGLLVLSDGFCIICFFIFFSPISYYIVFISQPSNFSCFYGSDWLRAGAGREWASGCVGTALWARVSPLTAP